MEDRWPVDNNLTPFLSLKSGKKSYQEATKLAGNEETKTLRITSDRKEKDFMRKTKRKTLLLFYYNARESSNGS
jgi:hypothetical protein